ncbi:MAG: hypothetical protein ABSH30_00800 [Acidimicrobiales bacterium]|jgi:hypothetical protein
MSGVRSVGWLRGTGALAVVLALMGMALAGCTAARNGLGTHDSQCFRVLPEARAAVGRSADFSGVRALPGNDLVKAIQDLRSTHGTPPDALMDIAPQTTCLVAYRGRFTVGTVSQGWAAEPGPYRAAVVVMGLSNDKVVATVLFRTVPHSIEFLHRLAFVT